MKEIYMKTFTGVAVGFVFSVLALSTGMVHAQMNMDHGNMAGMKMNAQAGATMTDGEVRKIDKDAQKITIKHGPIQNLGMPGMTMVFQVKDPALLDKVQIGDKVQFKAEKSGGATVVTELETLK